MKHHDSEIDQNRISQSLSVYEYNYATFCLAYVHCLTASELIYT